MKPNIKELRFAELETSLAEQGHPPYRARQIWQWLFQKRATSFSQMTNLSRSLRSWLSNEFSIGRLTVLRQAAAADGTIKYLFGLSDGRSIETVLIPEEKRLTLCISTQVGCAFGCGFCATALMGWQRDLTASEMVDQILEATRLAPGERRITHVVLMGMGEPLANYGETVRALGIMTNTAWGVGISPRRITVSSVGLVPQIQRLIRETRVNLAISLHAPTDEVRGRLMPVNRKYNLQQLMECCRSLPIPRRKRITFEYVLLRGVNDSAEDARQLCDLLEGVRCKVNVIPFNPHKGSGYQRPSESAVERFQRALYDRAVQVNVRRPRGDDIQAACGQLKGEGFLAPRFKDGLAAQAS